MKINNIFCSTSIYKTKILIDARIQQYNFLN
jgi:hypothetical protein